MTLGQVRVFDVEGRLIGSRANRMSEIGALAPIGREEGFVVIHRDGTVAIFDSPIAQNLRHGVPAEAAGSTRF